MDLIRYLDMNGISKKEFAERIGITYTDFVNAVNGKRGLPKKYWKKVILATNRKVTLDDLYDMHAKFKASKSRSR